MVRFCAEEGVAHEVCGKVIVAVTGEEIPRLQTIRERGQANGVACEWLDGEQLREHEPYARGVAALHVPDAGIADYVGVAEALRRRIEGAGSRVVTSAEVTGIRRSSASVTAGTAGGDYTGDFLVTCGGLQSDRLAGMSGSELDARVIPFRGEYFELTESARHLCTNLIYPVPNPAFPFLGVHLTRMARGGVEVGPNAILGLAREGYPKGSVDLRDAVATLGYSGFRSLARRHWRVGLDEIHRSLSRKAFARSLQRLVPELREEDLQPAEAGIRAQLVDRQGGLIDDFVFVESDRILHVTNAPSPAATASLAIGEAVARKVLERLA